jgi:hypothetical protein
LCTMSGDLRGGRRGAGRGLGAAAEPACCRSARRGRPAAADEPGATPLATALQRVLLATGGGSLLALLHCIGSGEGEAPAVAVVTGGPGCLPSGSDSLAPQPQPEGAGERGGMASLRFACGHCSGLLNELRGRQRAGSGAHAHAAAVQRLLGLPGTLGELEAPLLEARRGCAGRFRWLPRRARARLARWRARLTR